MSKADKMFEDLGYISLDLKDKWERIWGVNYQNHKKWISIKIDYKYGEIWIGTLEDDSEPVYITMKELRAINEKCKELGWIV